MACQTLYGTETSTITSLVTSQGQTTITIPPSTQTVTSTSLSSTCIVQTPGRPSGLSAPQPQPVTSCSTRTVTEVSYIVADGSTSVSNYNVVQTATSLSVNTYPTQTSCAAPAPAPAAPSTTAPVTPSTTAPLPPTTTSTPSSAAPASTTSSTSISVVVITTTLPNGQTSLTSSLTPVLVPAGQDTAAQFSGSSVPTGAIVGAVLGGAAAVFLLVLLAWGCLKRKGPFACLGSNSSDDLDGLDEEYWAPAIPIASSMDEEEMNEKRGGGGRSASLQSHEEPAEYVGGVGYHRRSDSGGEGGGFARSSSAYSYSSDHQRPRSPPLNYPSGPPSMHSTPSVYSIYPSLVTTTGQPGPGMYYAAPYPSTTGEYQSGLVRHHSAGSFTSPPNANGVITPAPYAPVQRSRSAHSARTLSYMQGQRLSQWAEGDEQFVEEPRSASSTEGSAGSPISPTDSTTAKLPYVASGIMRPLAVDPPPKEMLAESSWLGSAIHEQ